jgi:hypothetical protein
MARFADDKIFRISTETLEQIDEWIEAARATRRNMQFGIDALTMILARTQQAFAQEYSAGPVDPRMQNPGAAWKIPVRRISLRYYKGWKVRRMAPGMWMTYNDSREAFFIEFGIHPTGSKRSTKAGNIYTMRVRRPIRKLSTIKTLRFADQTRVGDKIWEQSFAAFRPGRFRLGRTLQRRGQVIGLDAIQNVTGMRFA